MGANLADQYEREWRRIQGDWRIKNDYDAWARALDAQAEEEQARNRTAGMQGLIEACYPDDPEFQLDMMEQAREARSSARMLGIVTVVLGTAILGSALYLLLRLAWWSMGARP